ncbi:MAG: cytidine deaminase [Actinomycetota bacterium]|nr:cytidine deaminase [Actinomycetota bacterium]
MKVDQALVDAAVDQMNRRWPTSPSAVAAAVYLDDGSILTGVSLSNFNSIMNLCAETGPITQAYTLDRKIAASVCISREADRDHFLVLAPCGACQERLALWGPDVEVGVLDSRTNNGWTSRRLIEVNPFYWPEPYAESGTWPSPAQHAWKVLE